MRTILKITAQSPVCSSSLQALLASRIFDRTLPVRVYPARILPLTPPSPQIASSPACAQGPACNQSNRCLTHCWMDDSQREQGQRCLVACWQTNHHVDRD